MHYSEGTAYSCQTLVAIGAIACHPVGQIKLNEICKSIADGFEIRFCKYPEMTIKINNSELPEWTEQICNEREQDLKHRIESVKKILPPEKFFWLLPRPRPQHVSGDIVVRVLELAYAKLMLAIDPASYPELSAALPESNPLDLYHHKNFHGDPGRALNDIINWPVTALIANGATCADLSKSFTEENQKNHTVIEKAYSELAEISNHPEKYVVVAGSVGTPGDSWLFLDPGTLIVPCHAFVVKHVDEKNKTICLLDPYNSHIGLLLEYSDFLQYFNMIAKATVRD